MFPGSGAELRLLTWTVLTRVCSCLVNPWAIDSFLFCTFLCVASASVTFSYHFLIFIFYVYLVIYLKSLGRGGPESGGGREKPKQAPHGQCRARLRLELGNCEITP